MSDEKTPGKPATQPQPDRVYPLREDAETRSSPGPNRPRIEPPEPWPRKK